jgi:hypothetical protein
MSDNPVT